MESEAENAGTEPTEPNDESKIEEDKKEVGNESNQTNDVISKVEERKTETKIKKEKKVSEKRPANAKRYDQYNHLLSISKASVRCKNEGCAKKSRVFCKKCKVHLCLMNRRNCFTNFHLLNGNSGRMLEGENKGIEVRPAHSIRFDEHRHFPLITAKSVRCKNEKCQKKTYIYCQKCKVHLCLVDGRDCFTKFHTLSMEEVKIE